MKKKMLMVGMVASLALTMTGCGSKNYTLSTEENDRVADYIANVMLERAYDNSWKYRKAKIETANKENSLMMNAASSGNVAGTTGSTTLSGTSNIGTTGSSNGTSSTNGTNSGTTNGSSQSADPMVTLAQKLQLTGASIKYNTFSVGDRYPTGEYVICVPANPGYKVLAVEFNIHNTSAAEVVANSKDSSITVKLSANGNSLNQETTILKNDISQLKDVSIAAGETYTAVAIFQIKEEDADNISKLSATIYSGATSLGSVNLK